MWKISFVRLIFGAAEEPERLDELLDEAEHSIAGITDVTPLKPLEAMAQGHLLVASDVGGHKELIRDGETGVLFKAGDVGALTKAVLDLLAQSERWDAIRADGRRFVEQERTWRSSVSRYVPVFEQLSRRVAA